MITIQHVDVDLDKDNQAAVSTASCCSFGAAVKVLAGKYGAQLKMGLQDGVQNFQELTLQQRSDFACQLPK